MPVFDEAGSGLVVQQPAALGARRVRPPEAIAALLLGVVAFLTCPFWFIGGPLGIVAVIGGRIVWRTGSEWTSQVGGAATALGATAVVFATFVLVFLTAF